jgi:hypothetical protein
VRDQRRLAGRRICHRSDKHGRTGSGFRVHLEAPGHLLRARGQAYGMERDLRRRGLRVRDQRRLAGRRICHRGDKHGRTGSGFRVHLEAPGHLLRRTGANARASGQGAPASAGLPPAMPSVQIAYAGRRTATHRRPAQAAPSRVAHLPSSPLSRSPLPRSPLPRSPLPRSSGWKLRRRLRRLRTCDLRTRRAIRRPSYAIEEGRRDRTCEAAACHDCGDGAGAGRPESLPRNTRLIPSAHSEHTGGVSI